MQARRKVHQNNFEDLRRRAAFEPQQFRQQAKTEQHLAEVYKTLGKGYLDLTDGLRFGRSALQAEAAGNQHLAADDARQALDHLRPVQKVISELKNQELPSQVKGDIQALKDFAGGIEKTLRKDFQRLSVPVDPVLKKPIFESISPASEVVAKLQTHQPPQRLGIGLGA
jgi:hypothetical protein